MTAKLEHRYATISTVVLAAIVVLIALGLQTAGQVRDDMGELDRALDLQVQTQRISATLLDLESKQRGYLLTGEADFIEPYRAALVQLDTEVRGLSATVASRPDMAAQLSRLRELLDAKRSELASMVALAQKQGSSVALSRVRENHGKALMDDIRQTLSHLDTLEGATRAQRQTARLATIQRNEQLVTLLAAALAVLMVALGALYRRQCLLQARMLRGETSARALLEQRVDERTRALQSTAQALALSEARLRGIFDAATDGILSTDAKQVIVEANPAAALLFRCTVTELIGLPLDRLIPERYRQAHRHQVEAFGAGAVAARQMGGGAAGRLVMALRLDGEEFPIEANISQVDIDGQRLYTVIHRDITARIKGEAALQESRFRLAAAMASMTDAVFISDAEGQLVEFNEAFASFHRFSSRAQCPRALAEYGQFIDVLMMNESPAPLEQWALSRALRGEAACNVEYRLRRKDTGECWIGSYSFAPMRAADGSTTGAVVSARDITDIKQGQAALAASHAALQDLIANQQHVQEDERKRIARELHDDLQQSLAAIRMDAVAVGERVSKGRNDVGPLLARIDSLSEAAISATRRIVSDLRPDLLENLGLVAAVEALCTHHAERTGADCRLEVSAAAMDARLDDSVLSTGLYRIAQEALNNVAKHAQATVVHVHLDCPHGGLVVLRVADDGIGMRARNAQGPKSFGLQGMAERVRALGGQLRINAETGKGTVIEALVPILDSGHTESHPAQAGPAVQAPAHAGEPALPVLGEAWGHSLQTVMDALSGSVAVLDSAGVVHTANKTWRDFAEASGGPSLQGCALGMNYLDVCRHSASTNPSAQVVLQGLRAVLQRNNPAFVTEYPRDTPDGRRWFRLHAAPITGGLSIITHDELDSRLDARPLAGAQTDLPPR